MLLTKIRLSGFKSFVDSTEIKFGEGLTGVVGPNGCGKSNIVDAVKWVLGESRVTELRSGQSKDVIFNGSGNRGPAGRASVELVFDNSDSSVTGSYSSFSDISVQRTILSDGTSSVSINGQQVRKKDVQDLFLGTGLGPRAYAIVGQGSITKIIESRPEDLRFYLEEAAGVSKYRVRKKEAENRLRDSKENLSRVNDLVAELDDRMDALRLQAESASQHQDKVLKKTSIENEILNRKEISLKEEVNKLNACSEKKRTELEITQIDHESKSLEFSNLKNKLYEKQNKIEQLNEEFFKVNSEIIKKENENKLLVQSIEQLSNQIAEIDREASRLDILTNDESIKLANAENSFHDLEKLLVKLESDFTSFEERLSPLVKKFENIEVLCGECNTQIALLKAERSNIEQKVLQGSEHLSEIEDRLTTLSAELKNIDNADSEKLKILRDEEVFLRDSNKKNAESYSIEKDALTSLQDTLGRKKRLLIDLEVEISSSRSKRDALSQIQEKLLSTEKLNDWLTDQGFESYEKLITRLEVDNEWNLAIEVALAQKLGAIVLKSKTQEEKIYTAELPADSFFIFDGKIVKDDYKLEEKSLAVKVISDCEVSNLVRTWLNFFLLAESDQFARENLDNLKENQCFVTRNGNVYGKAFRFIRATDTGPSIISREKQIYQLSVDIDENLARIGLLENEIKTLTSTIDMKEKEVLDKKKVCDAGQQKMHEAELSIAVLSQKHMSLKEKEKSLVSDLKKLGQDKDRFLSQQTELKKTSERNDTEQRILDTKLLENINESNFIKEKIDNLRTQVEALSREINEKKLEQRSMQELVSACNERYADLAERKNVLGKKRDDISSEKMQKEIDLKSAIMTESVQQKTEVEYKVQQNRKELTEIKESADFIEAEVKSLLDLNTNKKDEIHHLEVELAEKKTSYNQVAGEKEDKEKELNKIIDSEHQVALSTYLGVSLAQLERDRKRFVREIEELGPVNLAADNEMIAIKDRKEGLVKQVEDISLAEHELTAAIKKIDLETKDLLNNTFIEINKNLSFIFPKMFGGGTSRLILLEEDILNSGIGIQVQLPGKKTTSIQLLSGGEKSMAAVALIFAFFQLNPAPFCLLDEVDAALDDSNTNKLNSLILQLAKNTQFIFITHNKLSMEVASQLVGVTMREAGVSKVVSVDIESARSLSDQSVVQVS